MFKFSNFKSATAFVSPEPINLYLMPVPSLVCSSPEAENNICVSNSFSPVPYLPIVNANVPLPYVAPSFSLIALFWIKLSLACPAIKPKVVLVDEQLKFKSSTRHAIILLLELTLLTIPPTNPSAVVLLFSSVALEIELLNIFDVRISNAIPPAFTVNFNLAFFISTLSILRPIKLPATTATFWALSSTLLNLTFSIVPNTLFINPAKCVSPFVPLLSK